jgi:hypothetical protein
MDTTRKHYDQETARMLAAEIRNGLMRRVAGQQLDIVYGPAEVVDIKPSSRADCLGEWDRWRLKVKNHCVRGPATFSCALNEVFTGDELYPLFRSAFLPLGMKVKHPVASAHLEGDKDSGGMFTGAGRDLQIAENETIYLRPSGIDLANSMWLNAALRVDRPPQYGEQKLLVSCDFDPFDRDPELCFQRYHVGKIVNVRDMLNFFAYGGGTRQARDRYLPIARVVGVSFTAYWLELALNVELFTPTQPR